MAFLTLLRRELGSYFISPVAYVVFLACALIDGASFAFWVSYLSLNAIKNYTVLQACLNGFFFWFVLIVQVPLITMRVFSEEYKMGTVEMLLTAPVRDWEVVLAKYFGCLIFFAILWLPMVLDVLLLRWIGGDQVTIAWGPTLLSLSSVLLFGMFYVAVGVFTSAMTKNQIIAAVFSFALIFLTFSFGFIPYLNVSSQTQNLITYFSAIEQMETFSRGVFDSRPVVFYLSATVFLLFLTQRSLQGRRLKG